jgi:hypothetical protein
MDSLSDPVSTQNLGLSTKQKGPGSVLRAVWCRILGRLSGMTNRRISP